jgi:hypothetical protein
MPTKAMTAEQVAHLTQFVQPYWHDEKQCAAEVAMSVIGDQQREIESLKRELQTVNEELYELRSFKGRAVANMEQIKYVLGDQPVPAQILDTMRMVHDYGRLSDYINVALDQMKLK